MNTACSPLNKTWQVQSNVIIDHQRWIQTIDIIIFPTVVDRDVIAHRLPKGVVGCYTHQGPLGIDFRVRFGLLFFRLLLESNAKMYPF